MKSSFRSAGAVAGALFLSGCNLAPAYRVPTTFLPAGFKEAPGWRTAAPADAVAKGQWWLLFNDPVLTALEQRVAVNNQNVAAYAAAYAQARAAVREARAELFPTIDLSGSATRAGSFGNGGTTIIGGTVTNTGSSTGTTGTGTTGTGTTGTGTTGTGTTGTGTTGTGTGTTTTVSGGNGSKRYTLSLGASWEPDLWGRVLNGVRQQRGLAEASAGDLANATLSAQGELATDYVQLRGLEAQKAILDATVVAYRRAFTITNNRYTQGVAAKVDVLQAQTQLTTAQANAADLVRQRAIFEHAIAVLVGENPSSFVLAEQPWNRTVPDVPAILPSALLERRPDVAAAERRVAAANAAIGVERAAFFPTIGLSSSVGLNSSTLGSLFSAGSSLWSLGAQLAETLLDFGARSARVAGARAAWQQQVATYRQTALTAFQQVEDELAAAQVLAYVGGQRTIAAQTAAQVEQLTQNQYLAGQIAYTDVITSQATALTARQTEAQAIVDRQVAALTLIQAIGGSWPTPEPVRAIRPRAAMMLAGLFLLMAALALGGVTRDFDARLLAALRMPGEPGVADVPHWLVTAMLRLTWLGAGIVRAPVALLGALILLLGGARRPAIVLVAAWAGESLLVQLIKAAAGRARPELIWRLADASDTSFPSGHAAGTMLLYPLLGLLVGRLWSGRGGRIGATIGVAVALLVGTTRVLLGVHWASDVVAGWALGGALAFVASDLTHENKACT